jgi:ubiquinone/menaquinone biosynthesis C-methylase UbiE
MSTRMTTGFEFDQSDIAERYDIGRKTASTSVAALVEFMQANAPLVVRQVADLGCGTGRFTGLLATTFGAPVIGVELSSKMLGVAAAKGFGESVQFVRGSVSAIPIATCAIDVAFISQVLHHLSDLAAAMAEIRRVLAPGGRLFIRQTTRENLDSYFYQRFFPEARAIDERRLPSRDRLIAAGELAGLSPAAPVKTISTEVAATSREYVEKIATRTYSDLAMIADESFARGIDELTRFVTSKSDCAWFEDVDYMVFATPG